MIVSAQLRTATERPRIAWEEPACPLCGGGHRAPLLEAPDPHGDGPGLWFAVVRCGDCGLCFTSPRPDRATIGQFYPTSYRPHRRPRPARRSLLPALFRRPSVERQPLPWHGQGRLLDFGCGGGAFLELMRRRGWRVTGLDASSEAVACVREKLDVRAFVGTLPHPELGPESFDVVTMWHSLEHVHEPLPVLRSAHRLLAPGGRLLVVVPNFDSPAYRWFGPAWFGLDLPRHLTHFTSPTLRHMLERAGFRVTGVKPVRHSDWLRSSARLAERMGRRSLWQRALTRKPLAKLVAWGYSLAGRADCVMAMAEKG
jgi:2-polyprenyl-3-methyl-5-hydroxy-6-metoxy-1,4-benzoquinol methylase